MNYYCIQCKQEHRKQEGALLFKTGYTLIHEEKVPLGMCQAKQDKCYV